MTDHKIKNAFTEIKFFKRGNLFSLEITFLKFFPENYNREIGLKIFKNHIWYFSNLAALHND